MSKSAKCVNLIIKLIYCIPCICELVCVEIPEGSTVKGGRQRHDGVNHRQETQEEDEQ